MFARRIARPHGRRLPPAGTTHRYDGWQHSSDYVASGIRRGCRRRIDRHGACRSWRARRVRQARVAAGGNRRVQVQEGRMSAEAIYNVTIALRDRLKAAVTNHGVSGAVFVGPPNEVASGADLILFLYRVCPSATLRNSDHRVASAGPNGTVVYHNSLPFDLYFLVTVGATPAPGEEP